MPGPVIWVEGIMGSGKTTLVNLLGRRPGFRPVLEPVYEHPYLDLFYRDPRRWAFPMQMDMLFRRWELQQLALFESAVNYGVLLDRGMPGDYVFASMHHDTGNIGDLEWGTYSRMYGMLVRCHPLVPSMLLFLDVEPEVALARIKSRGRPAELGVKLDYLRRLREQYGKVMADIEGGKFAYMPKMTVERWDWNATMYGDGQEPRPYEQLISHISKVLAPDHGFNSGRSQRAENGGRP